LVSQLNEVRTENLQKLEECRKKLADERAANLDHQDTISEMKQIMAQQKNAMTEQLNERDLTIQQLRSQLNKLSALSSPQNTTLFSMRGQQRRVPAPLTGNPPQV